MSFKSRVLELFTNPARRVSTSDTMIVGAFVASTIVLFYAAFSDRLTEWLFIGYITAWVTQSQASKFSSIKRQREQQTTPEKEVAE